MMLLSTRAIVIFIDLNEELDHYSVANWTYRKTIYHRRVKPTINRHVAGLCLTKVRKNTVQMRLNFS